MATNIAEVTNNLVEITKSKNKEQALRRAISWLGLTDEDSKKVSLKSICELIKELGDKINSPDDNPKSLKTALHIAVQFKRPEVIRALLVANASFNIQDADGKTAVCYAAESDNEEIRKEIFTAVARAATTTMSQGIKYVPDEERQRPENNKLLQDAKQTGKDEFEENFDLATIQILRGITLDKGFDSKATAEQRLKHNQAKENLNLIIESLVRLDVMQETIKRHKLNLNYCGVTGWKLCAELFKQKAIQNGLLNVKSISVKLDDIGEHQILIIDADIDSKDRFQIKESTILCNPYKEDPEERILVGKAKVGQYLKAVKMVTASIDAKTMNERLSLNTSMTLVPFNNPIPRYENLAYGQKELRELIEGIKTIVLENLIKPRREGALKKFLSSKFCTLYEKQKENGCLAQLKASTNPQHKGIFDEMKFLYDSFKKQVPVVFRDFQGMGERHWMKSLVNGNVGAAAPITVEANAAAAASVASANVAVARKVVKRRN